MRNFRDMAEAAEAAYNFSKNRGHFSRDVDSDRSSYYDRSSYDDRGNRYFSERIGPRALGYSRPTGPRQTMDAHQPAGHEDSDMSTGNHRGKGPRNYRRSDIRIEELVGERMYEHPDLDASDIEVTVRDGEVILTGNVYDRQSKRLAEDLAEDVSGVVNVENRIKVIDRIMV